MSSFFPPFTEIGISVKNTETLNVITAIKQSDTDIIVVVGIDVNLFILLSKCSQSVTIFCCVNLELVTFIVKYTIKPSQRLPERKQVIEHQT